MYMYMWEVEPNVCFPFIAVIQSGSFSVTSGDFERLCGVELLVLFLQLL